MSESLHGASQIRHREVSTRGRDQLREPVAAATLAARTGDVKMRRAHSDSPRETEPVFMRGRMVAMVQEPSA